MLGQDASPAASAAAAPAKHGGCRACAPAPGRGVCAQRAAPSACAAPARAGPQGHPPRAVKGGNAQGGRSRGSATEGWPWVRLQAGFVLRRSSTPIDALSVAWKPGHVWSRRLSGARISTAPSPQPQLTCTRLMSSETISGSAANSAARSSATTETGGGRRREKGAVKHVLGCPSRSRLPRADRACALLWSREAGLADRSTEKQGSGGRGWRREASS
jgi:hypothetical protein